MSASEPSPGPLTALDLCGGMRADRRAFICLAAWGGAGLAVGHFGARTLWAQGPSRQPVYAMILVDYNRCTGCRTCEAACAQFNHPVTVDGEELRGLGNPSLSNIRVHAFNPDADVPVVCMMCRDNPCVAACPVEPDAEGRRALYRDPVLLTVRNDPSRCIACGACAEACRTQRVGAIIPNRETNRPERLCTLCGGGDPQCVALCPYGALSYIKGGLDGRHYALPPERIAAELIARWYGPAQGGDVR
ncbi:MAG TPA: 4Fe-4S dicluster domain-containing protein [Acidobacteriota bacterium]|jgi:Fe-S-cluster-containing hydrogenase component 2|nr:4Fe-4S dicluster domain-containing protein [Acidobacteriota bacterium]